MMEFGDIFANETTTMVYVCSSAAVLAAYALVVLWLRRPARAEAFDIARKAFATP